LDDAGFVISSKKVGMLSDTNQKPMREEMLSNALIWLLAKLSNFIAAGENLTVGPDSEGDTSSPIGVSLQALLSRWKRLKVEFIWRSGLPDTFAPCARLPPSKTDLADHFSEI
jgi:hypothetical protein